MKLSQTTEVSTITRICSNLEPQERFNKSSLTPRKSSCAQVRKLEGPLNCSEYRYLPPAKHCVFPFLFMSNVAELLL